MEILTGATPRSGTLSRACLRHIAAVLGLHRGLGRFDVDGIVDPTTHDRDGTCAGRDFPVVAPAIGALRAVPRLPTVHRHLDRRDDAAAGIGGSALDGSDDAGERSPVRDRKST